MDDSGATPPPVERLTTGIEGLDTVVGGGYLAGDAYLVRGPPGTGKTILGWQFLAAGDPGESVYLSFDEPAAKIRRNAATLGVDLSAVDVVDVSPEAGDFGEAERYDVFYSHAAEGNSLIDRIQDVLAERDPERVLLDPIHPLKHLTGDEHQFRTQLLGLFRFLQERSATVLLTSQPGASNPDEDLQFLTDGIVDLQRGADRTVEVAKFRGSDVQDGRHTMLIDRGGIRVVPRPIPEPTGERDLSRRLTSGVPELDTLLHGGLVRGTATVISGPTGVGKTTAGTLYLAAAAERGDRVVLYHFEETVPTFVERCRAIDIPVASLREEGRFAVERVEPTATTVGQFVGRVLDETADADVVMFDGIPGYRTLRGTDEDLRELLALTTSLTNRGTSVILTEETRAITGDFRATDSHISPLADTLVFMRYLELQGEIRRAVGVLKMRASDFERTLREFDITPEGVCVGRPLTELRGVLRGIPTQTTRRDSRGGDHEGTESE